MASVTALVLAAGKGKRMKSQLPKVLHPVAGRPMIDYVLEAVAEARPEQSVVVVGHGGEEVAGAVSPKCQVVYQKEQLGTGHAVMMAREFLAPADMVLVVCGDTPLLKGETLSSLLRQHRGSGSAATLLTARIDDPRGYGRVLRDSQGRVIRIVEEKDATEEERKIKEINTGVYCFSGPELSRALDELSPANAQGEFYLTDVVEILSRGKGEITSMMLDKVEEIMGVNDRLQLSQVESIIRQRINQSLMLEGVTMVDPASTYIDSSVTIEGDTVILPQTYIHGNTVIASGCRVGPHTEIRDSIIGPDCTIRFSVINQSQTGQGVSVGPFAYLRQGTVLEDGVKVGDFCEIKNSHIRKGSKVPHLSYVGDATVGPGANVGAGTITCNYDGFTKSRTEIGEGAFIGSNTNLVAPVKVGSHAYVAAGSTITEDIPPESLGVARGRQRNIEGWVRRRKGKS